ncbi:MAG: glycosyl hydrolase family 18 protein [Lachnospiraceae bacterium]
MKKKLTVAVLAICAAIVLLIVGLATGSFDELIGDSYADVSDYFGTPEAGTYTLVLPDGEQAETKAITIDGQEGYFFPWMEAADLLNSPLYVDEANQKGILARPDEIWYFTPGATGYDTESGQHVETTWTAIIEQNGAWYVNLLYLTQVMNLYLDTEHADIQTIVVMTDPQAQIADAASPDEKKGGIRIRTEDNKKAKVLTVANSVYLLESGEEWSKVMSHEGYVGYAANSELGGQKALAFAENAPEYTSISRDHKISLGWHQMTYASGNDSLGERLGVATGLNVISPTWFTVADTEGNITSLASAAYVQQAHDAGVEVWGLIDNFTNKIDMTAFMSNTAARTNMINQLITQAMTCGMDGINLDFESIKADQAVYYTELIRELSIACRKNGLVFSIDDPVPKFSSHYNRSVQGQVADYVIIMGYDENTAGSEKAGSNASLNFVAEGIEQTLKEVPASKVINAMPFYTRLWIESYDNGALECQTLGMTDANAYAREKGMDIYWDAASGQNIAELDTEQNLQKMWLEDDKSLEEKLKLLNTYQLAGGAFWKLGFESSEIWTLIGQYL